MEEHEPEVSFLKRRISRRQAIKAGGIAAAGLILSKPLIETVRPRPAFAQYVSGCCEAMGAQGQTFCFQTTQQNCQSAEVGGTFFANKTCNGQPVGTACV